MVEKKKSDFEKLVMLRSQPDKLNEGTIAGIMYLKKEDQDVFNEGFKNL